MVDLKAFKEMARQLRTECDGERSIFEPESWEDAHDEWFE